MKKITRDMYRLLLSVLLVCLSMLIWAQSDSTIVLSKSYRLKINCKELQSDSVKISLQNLSKRNIYFQVVSYTYPARVNDSLVVFIGLEANPLDDGHYYPLFALRPKEIFEIETEVLEIDFLKIYLTVLLDEKYVKRKFDKEKKQYSYKIENTVYHKMKKKYFFVMKV